MRQLSPTLAHKRGTFLLLFLGDEAEHVAHRIEVVEEGGHGGGVQDRVAPNF